MNDGAIDDAISFSAALTSVPDHLVLALRGEADLAVVPTLDRLLSDVGPASERIVIDASALRFVDCAVIGWIANLRRRGFVVRVDGATGLVARVLDVVGWTDGDGA